MMTKILKLVVLLVYFAFVRNVNGLPPIEISNPSDGFSQWSEFTECPVTCGTSYQQRSRSCLAERACVGDSLDFRACNTQACQVVGNWGSWAYKECSATCGVGKKVGTRDCIGINCEGEAKISTTCNAGLCPATLSHWTDWTSCTKTCHYGTHYRTRECLGTRTGAYCKGSLKDFAKCNINVKCPERWASWSGWSSCGVPVYSVILYAPSLAACLKRKVQRTRKCLNCKRKIREFRFCGRSECLSKTGDNFEDAAGNVVKFFKKGGVETYKFFKKNGQSAGEYIINKLKNWFG